MNLDWMNEGACRGRKDLNFFMISIEPGYGEMRASCLACCRSCPVVDQCLLHANETRETEGIWGGKTASQREVMVNGPYRDEVHPDNPFAPEVST